MLPSLDAEKAARAERRFRDEVTVWLTTVRADGQPQTSLVGTVWDGTTFLVLSDPDSPKVRNLRGSPRVSLHLDFQKDASSDGVLTLEGVAAVQLPAKGEPARLTERERAAYLERHLDAIRGVGMTPEEAFLELSAVIRVTPTRVRSY
jgi:PPOX class probable F420-dependent enzyme